MRWGIAHNGLQLPAGREIEVNNYQKLIHMKKENTSKSAIQPDLTGSLLLLPSASSIVDNVLNNHFGTTVKQVEVRLYDNGLYQFSQYFHTEHLAWAAGENWKSLTSSAKKSYEIVSQPKIETQKRFCSKCQKTTKHVIAKHTYNCVEGEVWQCPICGTNES